MHSTRNWSLIVAAAIALFLAVQPEVLEVREPMGIPVHLEQPTQMNFARLTDVCTAATGEVMVLVDGRWQLQRIGEDDVQMPAGPMICFVHTDGVDLGRGYANPTSHGTTQQYSNPTQAAVNRMKGLLHTPTPIAHWYEVEVTNPANGKTGRYVALADSGSSRSAYPAAWGRLGVETGGFENTITHLGESKVPCGVVKARLLRRAFDNGVDEHGIQKWKFVDLPRQLISAMRQQDPEVISKLAGEVAVIGLNNLDAWGLEVHPMKGLVHCGDV